MKHKKALSILCAAAVFGGFAAYSAPFGSIPAVVYAAETEDGIT